MKIGLQMYSVRDSFAGDPAGTIERLAEIGYAYVEFANDHAHTDPGVGIGIGADALRAILDRFGVTPIGCHISPFDSDTLPAVLDYHTELGTQSLAIPIDFWSNRQDVIDRAAVYNDLAARCAERGLGFLFHNHYHEFQIFEGERVLDLIVQHTDPDLVNIEMDTYWTFRGTEDPIVKIREYGNRVKVLHQKDYPLSEVRSLDVWTRLDREVPVTLEPFESVVRPEEFTEIGDGIMKVQEIIDAANDVGVSYLLVEQDHGRELTELARVERSLRNVSRMRGVATDGDPSR